MKFLLALIYLIYHEKQEYKDNERYHNHEVIYDKIMRVLIFTIFIFTLL